MQIFKWGKDISDTFYLDISIIKSESTCVFLKQISDLISDIQKNIEMSSNLINIDSLTMIEETLPYKG